MCEIDELHSKWVSIITRREKDAGWYFEVVKPDCSGFLTVVIVDDAIQGKEPPLPFEDEAFVIRAALNALDHADVMRVILSDHIDLNYNAALTQVAPDCAGERVCLLLDVYGPGERADVNSANPLGAQVAAAVINTKIPARNCRLFSKAGNQAIVDHYHLGPNIPKLTEYRDATAWTLLKSAINEWLTECGEFHASPFRKQGSTEPLTTLSNKCADFHRPGKTPSSHSVSDCVNNRFSAEALGILSEEMSAFVDSLEKTNNLSSDIGNRLMQPLVGDSASAEPMITFSISKALSRRQAKAKNSIPGEWLDLVLGSSTLTNQKIAIDLNLGVSVGGLLAAIGTLAGRHFTTSTLLRDETGIATLRLEFAIEQNNQGQGGLEVLAGAIDKRHRDRVFERVQSEQLDAFTAIFVAGFELTDLVFELTDLVNRSRLTVTVSTRSGMLVELE